MLSRGSAGRCAVQTLLRDGRRPRLGVNGVAPPVERRGEYAAANQSPITGEKVMLHRRFWPTRLRRISAAPLEESLRRRETAPHRERPTPDDDAHAPAVRETNGLTAGAAQQRAARHAWLAPVRTGQGKRQPEGLSREQVELRRGRLGKPSRPLLFLSIDSRVDPVSFPRRFLRLLALASFVAVASNAHAGPKDAQAEKVLDEIEDDYLQTKFDVAEQKLKGALEACGQTMCAPKVKAKLFAALGCVLASGKKQLEDAKDAFVEGLQLDKTITPIADMTSSEVTFAFEKARKELKLDASPKVDKPPPKPDEDKPKPKPKLEPECDGEKPCIEGSCVDGRCEKPVAPTLPPAKMNWVSISFEPDVAVVSGDNVCTADSQANAHYVCLRQSNSRYAGVPVENNADNVNTGFAISTLRLVLGYDRVLADNLTLGARIGFAFNGATDGGASFLPIHAELRASISPGRNPFQGTGVRPYFFLSGGVAQIDSKVEVEVLEDGNACKAKDPQSISSPCTMPSKDGVIEQRRQTLRAYKQAGPGFAGLGFGFAVSPVNGAAFHLGLRGSATFPTVAAVFTPEAGFLLGF